MGELLREAQQAGLFDGPLSTCETELQELLRQIDIMLSNKHQEWATETETLKLQCQAKEHEVMAQQTKLEASQRQGAQLNDKIEGMTSAQRQLVTDYEQQLSQLKSELSNLQRDYERVQKRHSKQASNAEKARDQTMEQLQEKQQELMASRNKLQEYDSQVRDWEVQHRAHRQQVEALESQRTTLAEKYQLMQQQSLGYQEQLSKRRQMLEQCELNYHSKLTHLEGQLSRTQDALEEKNANIQNLEERLIDADCQKLQFDEEYNKQKKQLEVFEKTNRDLEDQFSQLQIELQSRDDLIAASEQSVRQRNQDVSKLEESLIIKDNIIRTLKESSKEEETVMMITEMKQQVIDLQTELVRLQQNERHWRLEVERLQSRLDESHIECASLNTELAQKIDKLRHMEGTELRQLAEDLIKARGEQQDIEECHQAQLNGMKKEIAALTSDLHQRDAAIASLSSKSSGMERQLRDVNQQKERQSAELQLTNTHVEALRMENHNLQEVRALDVSATSRDLHQAEIQLQELEQLHRQHVQSSKSIEAENDKLKHELSSVQQQLQSLHTQSPRPTLDGRYSTESALDPILGKDRKLQEMESQHRTEVGRLQVRLDSATRRYEEEIGRLGKEQERLRQELKNKAHSMKRLQAENNAMGGFVSSAETITKSPPSKSVNVSLRSDSVRSPASRQLFRSEGTVLRENHSFPELFLSPVQSQLEYERPNSRTSITASFVAEDTRRRKELEQLLESHMTELEQRTDETLQRHSVQQNVGRSQQDGSS